MAGKAAQAPKKPAQSAANAPLTEAEKSDLEGTMNFLSFLAGPVPTGLAKLASTPVKPLAEAMDRLTISDKEALKNNTKNNKARSYSKW